VTGVLAFGPWQALLDALGWLLARIYDAVPNFGVAIIVLTVVIRLVLLPLGIKQIQSMQHMQAIQPKLKELQRRYKNNRQKLQEEQMKLYREAGVNPLGGCLPLLLQFPILIAMYSVLRTPLPNPEAATDPAAPAFVNNHYPVDSRLYADVTRHNNGGTRFLFMNLQCSLLQAGERVEIPDAAGDPSGQFLDCGDAKVPDTIPFALLLVLMVGTTFYQQRQMQKASPPGSQSPQQQAILRVMPLMFAFFGVSFPAGLGLYWTTSNVFQIGQQAFLLRAGHIGPDAIERRLAEQRARANEPRRKGWMERMMERAELAGADPGRRASGGRDRRASGGGGGKGGSRKGGGAPRERGARRPSDGSSEGSAGG
jgi:YidC/Oxa1 family membrane protein insertase